MQSLAVAIQTQHFSRTKRIRVASHLIKILSGYARR